jgi:hypothetical protein
LTGNSRKKQPTETTQNDSQGEHTITNGKLKTAAAFALLILLTGTAVAQNAENTKLKKLSQTDKIISNIQSTIPDIGPLSIVSADRGNFVPGDTVELKAETLCMEETGIRQTDWYASPGIWLQVEDPSGDIVFNNIIQDYGETADPGEVVYVKAGDCYSWTGDWNIPSDIGGEDGKYSFKIWEVIEEEDNSDLFEGADLGGRWEKISEAETASFRINTGEPEDRPPDAEIYAPNKNGEVGDEILFLAEQSTDDKGIEQYWWYKDGNLRTITEVNQIEIPFDTPGEHTVKVEAQDTAGQKSSDSVTVYIESDTNRKPVIPSITKSKSSPETGEQVTLSARKASDPDGQIVSYDWSNGRNVKTFSTIFETPGRKTLEVTVEDNEGATATASTTIDVQNRPPEAVIQVDDQNPSVGETVQFSADESSDPDGEILAYNWDIGNRDRQNIEHSFSSPGEKTVELQVTDDRGAQGSDTVTVNVQARDSDGDGIPDREDACPEEGGQGFGLKDNGCPVRDSDDDGVPDPEDDCPGESGLEELDGCRNEPPEVSNFILSKSQAEVGETLTAEVSASDPNDQDLSYTWSIPGNTVGDTTQPSFSFKNTGTKTVTVEITDGFDTVTRQQEVTIVEPESEENRTVGLPPENNVTTPGPEPEPGTPGEEAPGEDENQDTGEDLGPIQTVFFGFIDLIGGVL